MRTQNFWRLVFRDGYHQLKKFDPTDNTTTTLHSVNEAFAADSDDTKSLSGESQLGAE